MVLTGIVACTFAGIWYRPCGVSYQQTTQLREASRRRASMQPEDVGRIHHVPVQVDIRALNEQLAWEESGQREKSDKRQTDRERERKRERERERLR